MDMTLKRYAWRPNGVFSNLLLNDDSQFCVTLEHAYLGEDGGVTAKIPSGTYTCKRSMHELHGMTEPFETFQIMDVPGHDNILFHWGNFNKDSEGCVLLGRKDMIDMITDSRAMFSSFMKLHEGEDSFALTVI